MTHQYYGLEAQHKARNDFVISLEGMKTVLIYLFHPFLYLSPQRGGYDLRLHINLPDSKPNLKTKGGQN